MKHTNSKTILLLLTATLLIGGTMLILPLMGFMQQDDEWKAPPAADKMKNPLTEKSLAEGKILYEKKCVSCHGKKGKGDGPKAEELEKEVGDVTIAKFSEQSDGAIYWKTTEGKKPMPSFKLELTDDQRWQLVNYLRELGKETPKKEEGK